MKKFTLIVNDSTAALLGLYFMSKHIEFEAEHISDSAPNIGGAVAKQPATTASTPSIRDMDRVMDTLETHRAGQVHPFLFEY